MQASLSRNLSNSNSFFPISPNAYARSNDAAACVDLALAFGLTGKERVFDLNYG
jgi:hypothetical protein